MSGSLLGGVGNLIGSIGSLFPTTTDTTTSSSGTASSNTTAEQNSGAFSDTQSQQSGSSFLSNILDSLVNTFSQANTSNQTTSNNQTSSFNNANSTNLVQGSNTVNTVGTVGTSNSIINSADPAVIASLKSLASTAMGNASNANNQTAGLVAGLFQTAKDSFASTFGQQAGSGLYNSSTTGVLQQSAEARAAADAASAVLGYQTQEQGIAQGALTSLLSATATQVQQGLTSTNQAVTTTNSQLTQDASSQNAGSTQTGATSSTGSSTQYGSTASSSDQQESQTNNETAGQITVQGASSDSTQATKQKQQTQATSTSTTSKGSLVCTWMWKNGFLSREEFYVSSVDFYKNYTELGREAYLFWGRRLIPILEKNIDSKLSKLILWLFWKRTDHVCAEARAFGRVRTPSTWVAKKVIYCCVFPVGLYLCFNRLFFKLLAPLTGKLKDVR